MNAYNLLHKNVIYIESQLVTILIVCLMSRVWKLMFL